jgi:tetratricopeptide (TPR) repeat protein
MRNVQNGSMARIIRMTRAAGLLAMFFLIGGCANNGPKEKLAAAYQQLDTQNPSYVEISAAADAYLQASPTGPAAADAYYLQGRALEAKSQRDPASPQKDCADAYNAYSQALAQKPRLGLEGLIHVGMGNILYFQDRYAAAVGELTAGYEKLERDNDKAWALYRIALSQQRLGRWAEADKNYTLVQQQFPSTEPAARARDKRGYNAFWVQVATFPNPQVASAAMAELKKQGMPAQLFVDTTRNAQVVRVGPLSYEGATATRQKVLTKYPYAAIVP